MTDEVQKKLLTDFLVDKIEVEVLLSKSILQRLRSLSEEDILVFHEFFNEYNCVTNRPE